MKKLSPPQEKALAVIRRNGDAIVANGALAGAHRITFATLLSLERAGRLRSGPLKMGNWHFEVAK